MTKSSGTSKWVVVGGAGFIGSNLCRALLDRGDRVVCIDNLITGRWSNVTDLIERGMVCFKHDVTNEPVPDRLASVMEGVDGVYFLASIASPKFYLKYPMETIEVNTVGLKHWLDACCVADANCPLVYTSTSEVYGDPQIPVQREDYNGNVDPMNERACYDESKRLGETLCSVYRRNNWTDARVVRIFNTYGPGMSPDDGRVLPNFINQALDGKPITVYGDGSQTRSFCYIRDMVEGLTRTMDYGWNGVISHGELPQVMNLGNAMDHFSIKEVAEKVRGAINPELDIVTDESKLIEGDPKKRRPNCVLANRFLQWMSTTKFDEGLRETIKYFRELRDVGSNSE